MTNYKNSRSETGRKQQQRTEIRAKPGEKENKGRVRINLIKRES